MVLAHHDQLCDALNSLLWNVFRDSHNFVLELRHCSCRMNWVTSTDSSKERAAHLRCDVHTCHDFHKICGIGTSTSCSAVFSMSSIVIYDTGASTVCSTKSGRVELLFAVRERTAPPFFAAPRHSRGVWGRSWSPPPPPPLPPHQPCTIMGLCRPVVGTSNDGKAIRSGSPRHEPRASGRG